MHPGSGPMEGSNWEGQNFHSKSEVVEPDEREEGDMPLGLLICSIVVSSGLFHVLVCRHISSSNFYVVSAVSHTCLVLLSLGVVDRLCYTVFLWALYTIYFSLLVLLVVNIALVLVTHGAISLVDCICSVWISPLQSQAYKVMSKQTEVAQQCF